MEIGYEALNFDGSIPDVYEALMNDLVEIEENEDDE